MSIIPSKKTGDVPSGANSSIARPSTFAISSNVRQNRCRLFPRHTMPTFFASGDAAISMAFTMPFLDRHLGRLRRPKTKRRQLWMKPRSCGTKECTKISRILCSTSRTAVTRLCGFLSDQSGFRFGCWFSDLILSLAQFYFYLFVRHCCCLPCCYFTRSCWLLLALKLC
jgi:hypothetical protein